MKLGGMTRAINGACIDTERMLAAMTQHEKHHLMQEVHLSLEQARSLKAVKDAAKEVKP